MDYYEIVFGICMLFVGIIFITFNKKLANLNIMRNPYRTREEIVKEPYTKGSSGVYLGSGIIEIVLGLILIFLGIIS